MTPVSIEMYEVLSMIGEMVQISGEDAGRRKSDPACLERMVLAAKGQSPPYLLISPVDHSAQDLEALSLMQGDAFHATRVPGLALLKPDQSLILFGGPGAYCSEFEDKRAVILTFKTEESNEIIQTSISQVRAHADLHSVPVVALRIDYDQGRARLVAHGAGRAYDVENSLLRSIRRTEPVNQDVLTVLCSDSRIRPPRSKLGLPMAIRTLGGYVPAYTGQQDETASLNDFFLSWLSNTPERRHVVIVAHGDFDGRGSSCGAGKASLGSESIHNPLLKRVIQMMRDDAGQYEKGLPRSPEVRVRSIAEATRANILSYPSVASMVRECRTPADFIGTAYMGTVTNVMTEIS